MACKRAVAYYRSASGDQAQLEQQRRDVHFYAQKHGMEIFAEISESGSGLNTDRPGLNAIIEQFVTNLKLDFSYVLMTDVSRLGRFETHKHTAFENLCQKHKKPIVYTYAGERALKNVIERMNRKELTDMLYAASSIGQSHSTFGD